MMKHARTTPPPNENATGPSETNHHTYGESLTDIRRLNNVDEVLRAEGISHRSFANKLGVSVSEAREYRDPFRNLSLSELHQISAAIDVGTERLLVDTGTGLGPHLGRAQVMKILKTARAMDREIRSSDPGTVGHSSNLLDQLRELVKGESHLADLNHEFFFGPSDGNGPAKAGQRAIKAMKKSDPD